MGWNNNWTGWAANTWEGLGTGASYDVGVVEAFTLGDSQNTISSTDVNVIETVVLNDEVATGAVLATVGVIENIDVQDVQDVSFEGSVAVSEGVILGDSSDVESSPAGTDAGVVESFSLTDSQSIDVYGRPDLGRTYVLPKRLSARTMSSVPRVLKPYKEPDEDDFHGFDLSNVLTAGEEILDTPLIKPIISVTYKRGTVDPDIADMLEDSPVLVAGPLVSILIKAGKHRAEYLITLTAWTNKNRTINDWAVIRVRDPALR